MEQLISAILDVVPNVSLSAGNAPISYPHVRLGDIIEVEEETKDLDKPHYNTELHLFNIDYGAASTLQLAEEIKNSLRLLTELNLRGSTLMIDEQLSSGEQVYHVVIRFGFKDYNNWRKK